MPYTALSSENNAAMVKAPERRFNKGLCVLWLRLHSQDVTVHTWMRDRLGRSYDPLDLSSGFYVLVQCWVVEVGVSGSNKDTRLLLLLEKSFAHGSKCKSSPFLRATVAD
ncbi:uncharacterized [Tachysurus ichikawai]